MPAKQKAKGNIKKRNPWILPALLAAFFVIYFISIFFIIFVTVATPKNLALILIPFGILFIALIVYASYYFYWLYKTKEEINSMGASIPTFILVLIPIANLYWYYKYAQGFVKYVKNGSGDDTILWFIIMIFLGPIVAYFIQKELNNYAK